MTPPHRSSSRISSRGRRCGQRFGPLSLLWLLLLFLFVPCPQWGTVHVVQGWKFPLLGGRGKKRSNDSSGTDNQEERSAPQQQEQQQQQHQQQSPPQQSTTTFSSSSSSSSSPGGGAGHNGANSNALHSSDPLQLLVQHMWSILTYKPPVGIVALYTMTRLVVSGRLFNWQEDVPKDSVEALLQKQQQQSTLDDATSRAFVLDVDDKRYRRFGGIDRVRQKLLWAALLPYKTLTTTTTATATTSKISETTHSLISHVVRALSIHCQPGRRRIFVQELIVPLAHMEALQKQLEAKPLNKASTKTPERLEQVLIMAIQCAHMRIMDALVRVCRDRLLRTTYRLARTVNHWTRRVETRQQWSAIFFGGAKNKERVIEGDRLRLFYAKAAYRAEVERLGRLAQLLQQRPADLEERFLLDAMQETERVQLEAKTAAAQMQQEDLLDMDNSRMEKGKAKSRREAQRKQKLLKQKEKDEAKDPSLNETDVNWRQSFAQSLKQKMTPANWKLPWLSRYSIRWMADGASSFLSIRKWDGQGTIHAEAAMNALLGSNESHWLEDTSHWNQECRSLVCSILRESLRGSSSGGTFDEEDFAQLQDLWLEGRPECTIIMDDTASSNATTATNVCSPLDIAQDWTRILQYVDSLPLWRRMGEGRAVRLRDAAFISWTRRLNFLGLPLAALQIMAAHRFHDWIVPHWPRLKKDGTQIFWKTLEILQQRVWVPLKGIYDELMNRSKGIMSGFGLKLEERSLDHMLRDLGFGDGTAETRSQALEKAATQYEQDLKKGLMLNFASGHLIRLLLVQVQQLKVGVLSALDTIDILIKGNQIHFQILAAIPAVLIFTYGAKLFVKFLYNIRSKDYRPVNAAHMEMTTYLNQLESLVLILSSSSPSSDSTSSSPPSSALTLPGSKRDSAVLGEILLYMHRYLILLDFSSWSIPSRASDDIHRSLRQLLAEVSPQPSVEGSAELQQEKQTSTLSKNMHWIRLVKERHEGLHQYF